MNDSTPPIELAAYVAQTLELLGLSVPDHQRDSVIKNFQQVHVIAQQVLEFPLPDSLEAMPTFKP